MRKVFYKNLGSFGFELFVGDVILGVRLGFSGLRHQAPDHNRSSLFLLKKARRKSASLQPMIGF